MVQEKNAPRPKLKLIVTRHESLVRSLKAVAQDPDIQHVLQAPIDQLSSGDVVIGVLPIDLIKKVVDKTGRFIYVGIDPEKFKQYFGVDYNPKTADQYISQLPPDQLVKLYRFVEYTKVDIDKVEGFPNVSGKKVFYKGSPVIAKALESRGAQLVSSPDEADMIFTPVEGKPFYSIRFLDRDLIVNTPEEFFKALDEGKVAIMSVNAEVRAVDLQYVINLLN